MKTLTTAALAALTAICLASGARAGCVISPDGKSIDVVTDNGASDEKNCAVKCQVDTKIGVVQVSCGGNTPPLAKAYSLCNFDKPESWYKKVVSAQDTCTGGAASATPAPPPTAAAPVPAAPPVAAAPAPAAVKAGTYICRIAPDGHSFDAMIANPYSADTSCQVNCQISTTLAGTTEQSSCTKNVAAGAGAVVLCTHTFDKGRLVKVIGGSGSCLNPVPQPASADTGDNDDDDKSAGMPLPNPAAKDSVNMEELANDPAKMREYMRQQLPPEARKMFDQTNKP
jgi:hypothetical protein